ncbi:hypothetical protein [Emticicia sp. C21]|uniref:hypothetical protein n=1 Tax=Emticicia sp. C21 TaxID=2302915 RepID=UPI000E9C972D|nr:hypothetical protein [Emticicia sp. C21]RFS17064.1 hypothetical protein D0T08_10335 [Emticicia sp. C21]
MKKSLLLFFSLSIICVVVAGCGDSQTESLAPCLKGTFGGNSPLKVFSDEDIKNNEVTKLEKRLTFRDDGTGFYYIPVVKNQFPEYRVEFTYTNKNEIVELTATKLYINGVEAPPDGVNKDEVLLEKRLKFYKLFPARVQQLNCNCTSSTLQTNFLGKIDYFSPLDNMGDIVFEWNKITDVPTWVKRN